jgi:hypothetical protein
MGCENSRPLPKRKRGKKKRSARKEQTFIIFEGMAVRNHAERKRFDKYRFDRNKEKLNKRQYSSSLEDTLTRSDLRNEQR